MNTINQKNAILVHQKVTDFQKNHKEDQLKEQCNKYGVMAMKLPVLVQKAGLAQALAFVDMKGKNEKTNPVYIFLNDLAEVIFEDLGSNQNKRELFLKRSRSDDLQDYMLLTRKTMVALDWFRRYAQSILKVSSTTTEDDE